MKSYKELFDKEFKVSQEIDDNFAKICNQEGFKKGIEYLKNLDCKWLYDDDYLILYFISTWTKKNPSEEQLKTLIESIKKQKDIIDVKEVTNEIYQIPELIIKKNDYEIKVMKYSDLNPSILELLPDLETDKRAGTCFSKAFDISFTIKKNDIVTGYIYGYTDKSKYLHSWNEAKLKKCGEVVVDGTLNTVMNKEAFYRLRHLNVLTRISSETLKEDIDKYLHHFNTIAPEVYYVFRDEIVKDLEKNPDMLKNNIVLRFIVINYILLVRKVFL